MTGRAALGSKKRKTKRRVERPEVPEAKPSPPAAAEAEPVVEATAVRPVRLVAVGCTVLVVLQWIAPFLPGHLAWGIHHLAYVPLWVRSLWCGLVLALLWIPGPLLPKLEIGVGRGLARRSAPLLLAAGGGALFWLLRTRTHFLGDGYLVGELVDRGMSYRTFDFLDFFLHATVWKLFEQGGGVSAFRVYAWASVLAGVCYLLSARWASLRLVTDPSGRALLFGLLVFAGPLQMFFGYVESYSFQAVFLLLYFAASVLALRGQAPYWRAGVLFGLALAFHTTSVFLAPTLLFLALARLRQRGWLRQAGSALLPAGGVVLAAAGILVLTGYRYRNFELDVIENRHAQSVFLDLLGTHGLLSTYHLKDTVNLLLLLVPVPSVLIVSSLGRGLHRFWESAERRFLTIGAITLLVLLVVIDRKLGGARDWDLLAAHVSIITVLAVLVWSSWALAKGRVQGKAAFLVVTAFSLAAPWYWVNAGEDRSIERFRDIITDMSSFKRAYSHEEIGKHFRNKGDLEESMKEYEICVETFPSNGRFWALLGGMRTDIGEYDSALVAFDKALSIEPENLTVHKMLAKALHRMGQPEKALPHLEKVLRKRGRDPAAWAQYGISARDAGRLERSIEAFDRSLELEPNPRVKFERAVAYGMNDQWDTAAEAFRELMSDPEIGVRATYGLATTLSIQVHKDTSLDEAAKDARLQEAQRLYEMYLAKEPDDAQAQRAYERVKELRSGMAGDGGGTP